MIDNVNDIMRRVEAAAKLGSNVKIVAATKTVPPERINAIRALGIGAMGENRVQELLSKYDALEMDEIHFIGALQTNKVKYIIDKVSLIQSVDRFELAKEIDKRAKAINKVMPVLIEVNIGGEESKSGCSEENLFEFIIKLKELGNLRIDGLMSVLPIDADRALYERMYDLYKKADKLFGGMKYLSMGMSEDFELAIECGANMVRIGSGIFGKRQQIREGEK